MREKTDMAQLKVRVRAAHEAFSELVRKLNAGELEESKKQRIYELEKEVSDMLAQMESENRKLRERISERRAKIKESEMEIERFKARIKVLEKH